VGVAQTGQLERIQNVTPALRSVDSRSYASEIASVVSPPRRDDEDRRRGRQHAVDPVHHALAHRSEAILETVAQVQRVAPTNATVLLLGETGVGKEFFAQAIHDASPRRDRPMIRVSCAAIPATLIESELFGHERGAFTGALSRQIGRFEAAHGSTLFLDEIGDVPLETQVKLLRVLEERTIERLGDKGSIKVDVRIIAATNRNLEKAVMTNAFREDLFYRLNVFPLTVPPLRERIADIPGLVWTFIDKLAPSIGKRIEGITEQGLLELQRYSWPGNVRELRNLIEREIILAAGPMLSPVAPKSRSSNRAVGASSPVVPRSERLVDVQIAHIRSVLDECGWRIRGANGAAARLDIKPTTLETRMARLGIRRESANLS
jgi:transcriptional regulator with GAF, ATPase, and Fis domain